MPTTRPALVRYARLTFAGLVLPLTGAAVLSTASPAGALEPHVLTIAADQHVSEEDGGSLTVELSGGAADEDIDFTTTMNLQYSQTDASDFVAVDILGTVPAGQTSVEVPVLLADDDLIEGIEQFYAVVSSISGPAEAGPKAHVTIKDEDRAYLALTLGDDDVQELAVPEGDDGQTVVPVTVHVSDPLANGISVGVGITFSGCSTVSEDDLWVFDGGTIDIPAGVHEASGSIIVNGDTKDELDECAEIWVSAYDMNTFHEMGDNSAELTILDDDDTVLSDAPHGDDPECEGPSCDLTSAEPTDPGDDPQVPGDEPADQPVEVPADAAPATLPRTGSNTTEALAVAGIALVALGSAARRTARRLG